MRPLFHEWLLLFQRMYKLLIEQESKLQALPLLQTQVRPWSVKKEGGRWQQIYLTYTNKNRNLNLASSTFENSIQVFLSDFQVLHVTFIKNSDFIVSSCQRSILF